MTHVSWLVLVRQVYRKDDRCLPPKPDPGMGSSKKELVERRLASRGYEKPFVQSHPGKSGYNWYVRSEQVAPGALPLTSCAPRRLLPPAPSRHSRKPHVKSTTPRSFNGRCNRRAWRRRRSAARSTWERWVRQGLGAGGRSSHPQRVPCVQDFVEACGSASVQAFLGSQDAPVTLDRACRVPCRDCWIAAVDGPAPLVVPRVARQDAYTRFFPCEGVLVLMEPT